MQSVYELSSVHPLLGIPLSRSDLPFRRVGDFAVIHKGKTKLILNESATRLVESLDGVRKVGEILSQPSYINPNLPETYLNSFLLLLENLIQLKVLRFSGNASSISTNTFTSCLSSARDESKCATPGIRKRRESTTIEDRLEDYYWENYLIYKMYLELTYRCNFRCTHCYNPTHHNVGELTTSHWVSVLEQLKDMGCYILAITGGEPFVRKDIAEILIAAKEFGFSIRINTNASLVRREHIDLLKSLGDHLQELYISFYGGNDATSRVVTGNSTGFTASLEATRALHSDGVPVYTKFITLKDNAHEGRLFESMMSQEGIPHVVNLETVNPRADRNVSSLVQLVPLKEFASIVEDRNIAPRPSSGGSDCRPGHIRGAVTPDGEVSPCEWLTDFKFGNVASAPLRDVWYGPAFQAFRKMFETEEAECPSCHLSSACGRCPAHSYLETGSLFKCAPNHRRDAEVIFRRHRAEGKGNNEE